MKLYKLERIKPLEPSPDGRGAQAHEIILLANDEHTARRLAMEHDQNLVWLNAQVTSCEELDIKEEQIISVYSL